MLLQQQTEEASRNAASELRLDRETAEKVTALALRLQEKRGATLSVHEIEEAGKEVGLEPEFIREAVAQVRQPERRLADKASGWMRWGKVIHPAWWASGWAVPIALAAGADALGIPDGFAGAAFMGGMGVYVGFGVVLSMLFGDQASKPLTGDEQEALLRSIGNWTQPRTEPIAAAPKTAPPPTAALRPTVLESETYLSVVPRCPPGGRPAKDYSAWALTLIWEEGGELLSANADGIECRFTSANAAFRAARRLQTEVQGAASRLGVEFLACGVSRDLVESRRLAEGVAAGDIMFDQSLAAEGLQELGRLARLEWGESGALSWKAARDG